MNSLEPPQNMEQSVPPADESSFGDVLRQFEAEHHNVQGPEAALEGTVLSVSADGIVVDVGRKMEGVLRGDLTALERSSVSPKEIVAVKNKVAGAAPGRSSRRQGSRSHHRTHR